MISKIVIVTNSASGGGAERSMNILGNLLEERGITASRIFVKDSEHDLINITSRKYTLIPGGNGNLRNFFSKLSAVFKFCWLLYRIKPDVVILNCDFPEFLGVFCTKKTRVIIVEHTPFPFSKRRFVGRIIRFIHVKRKSTFVAVSQIDYIWPFKKKFVNVIENLNQYPNRLEKSSKWPISRLVFIGRLSHEKRPFDVLEIAHLSELPLIMIGTGNLYAPLVKLAERLTLNIEFLGQVINPWNLINEGDILIVTSEYEGDGLVLIEGMAKGVPILARDIPSLRRFEMPHLNYSNSTSDFVEKISIHIKDASPLIPPEECFRKISAFREPQLIVEKWLTIFDNLTSPKRL